MNYLASTNSQPKSLQAKFASSRLLMTTLGFLLLAFASQLSIPLEPVPLTFQSVTVIFIGMTFGMRTGMYIVMAYFLAGICGLPVFADYSTGIAKFFGPTGGYLTAFLPAVIVSGYLAERGFTKNIGLSFITALIANSVIIGFGIMYLATFVGFKSAIQLGLMPFMFSEIIKLAVLAGIIPTLNKKLS